MDETVDGEYQNFKAKGGKYTRDNFWKDPVTKQMVARMTDEEIENLNRGGHDPIEVLMLTEEPTVKKINPQLFWHLRLKVMESVLVKLTTRLTVKKNCNENLENFIDNFNLPVKKDSLDNPDYLELDKKDKDYMLQRRIALGGFLPSRKVENTKLSPEKKSFEIFDEGTEKELSTTMVFVRLLTKLLRDKNIGSRVVPIVPDEARTFGMDSLFRQFGIYSSEGQKYEQKILIK